MALTQTFRDKVEAVARRLRIDPEDLLAVMRFETGGTFDPAIRNRAGSGATGLVQFLPATAKALGTTTEKLAQMSAEDQLDYVEKYFQPYKGRMQNLNDVYMAVLYPKALGKPEWYPLFRQDQQPTAYAQNAGLDRDKKGMVTVGDAVAAVRRSSGMEAPTTMTASRQGTPGRDWGQTLGFTAQAQAETDAVSLPSLEGTDWAQRLFGETAPSQTGGGSQGRDWVQILFG